MEKKGNSSSKGQNVLPFAFKRVMSTGAFSRPRVTGFKLFPKMYNSVII